MDLDWTLTTFAQAQPWDGHMMWGWGWMWIFGLLSVLLLAAVIATVVWSAARSSHPTVPDPAVRAREILNERYARGEISTEEYQERLNTLR